MRSATGSRFGRRAALLAALGTAAVAALAAPGGVRWLRQTYAIHQLGSANHAEVLGGIATLVRLKSARGAKRILELAGELRQRPYDPSPAATESWNAMMNALNELPMSEGMLIQRAQSGGAGERLLALVYIGQKRIEAALPLLRGIAAEGGLLSKQAILSLAQVLPTVKVLGTRTTGAGIEARFRLENATGFDLWYRGPLSKPACVRAGRGQQDHPHLNLNESHRLRQGESVEFTEEFAWRELPASLDVLIWTSDGLESFGMVRSETVERPRGGEAEK